MRAFSQITDLDGGNAYTIPTLDRREQPIRPFRPVLTELPGADGAFDQYGSDRAPLGQGQADISFLLDAATPAALQTAINDAINGAMGATRQDGLRKLWRAEESDGSAPRWTHARLAEMGDPPADVDHIVHTPLRLMFLLPDPLFYDGLTTAWLIANGYIAETLASPVIGEPVDPYYTFAKFSIAETPFNFTITNAGDMPARHIIFRFVAQGVNGFTDPAVVNETNAMSFSHTQDGAAAGNVLSVNASPGLGRARYAASAPPSADVTAGLALGATQGVLMELEPGANAMRYDDGGTPDLDLYVWWLHAYRD